MHPVLSFVLVALGITGFAIAALTAKVVTGYYRYGTELVLYATLVAAGIALYRGWTVGRVMALAWLRVGSWAIFLVPIGIVLWLAMLQGGTANIFQVLGGLLFAVLFLAHGPGEKPALSPLWFVVGALAALAVLSFACARLYRRIAMAGAPASGTLAVSVQILAVAFIVVAFTAQHRFGVSDYTLPMALRSADSQEQSRKVREQALQALVGEPLIVDGGKGLVYPIRDHSLVYVDVATGQAARKTLPPDVLKNPGQSVQRREARFSAETGLFWSGWTRELVDLHTGRAVKPAIEQDWDRYVSIGFLDGGKRVLLLDKTATRVVAVDTASGAVLFSTDITPPGGFSSDQNRRELSERAAARSAFSGDRARLAWFYLDALYVLDTASGALESLAAAGAQDAHVHYSSDSSHVLMITAYDPRRGMLIDMASKTAVEHDLHALQVLHFSSAVGLIAWLPGDNKRPNETRLARWRLADVRAPVWTATLDNRWYMRASADGRRLFMYNPTSHQLESADVDALKDEARIVPAPLPVALHPGPLRWMSYFPEGGGILVPVQSPKMTVVRLDPSGAVAGSSVIDFTPFSGLPK